MRDAGLTDVVLLGMGGSSLAPEVFRRSEPAAEGALRAARARLDRAARRSRRVADAIDLATTLFIVSSKSGGTIEPNALLAYFRGAASPTPRTSSRSPTRARRCTSWPRREGFRRVFLADPEIGGRYSRAVALRHRARPRSPASTSRPCSRARRSRPRTASCRRATRACGSAPRSASWRGRGRDKLTFVVDPPLTAFGLWAEQLVAESTGKQGRGILPIADEPLVDAGAPTGHDRVFVHLRDADAPDPRHAEAIGALAAAGHPTITRDRRRARATSAAIFFFSEFATAVAGWALGDQPVRPAQRPGGEGQHGEGARAGRAGGPRGRVADRAARRTGAARVPGDHGLPARTTRPSTRAVAGLRAALIERHGVATTFGYGPRFLHSTGQFHKGGPPAGRFLQLVHDAPDDLEVPGQPYTFRTLIGAQADGDLQTLRAHGLPAARVRLPAGDLAGAITRLQEDL